MRYPVKVRQDGEFYLVTFPDIPEAITQGETLDEAMTAAAEALETALEFYFEDNRTIPMPSALKRSAKFIELPVSVAAKVLLLNEMVAQKVYPAELAKKMGATRQEVSRLVDLHYGSKIDSIADAMKALGKTIEVTTVAA